MIVIARNIRFYYCYFHFSFDEINKHGLISGCYHDWICGNFSIPFEF